MRGRHASQKTIDRISELLKQGLEPIKVADKVKRSLHLVWWVQAARVEHECHFDKGDGTCWAKACYSDEACGGKDADGNPRYRSGGCNGDCSIHYDTGVCPEDCPSKGK